MALYQKTPYDYINTALELAVKAHTGQVDKGNGLPYILHPLTVASRVKTPEQKAAAILHDTLEDTNLALEDFRQAGIPERVIELVEILTDPKDGDFASYINRITEDFDASVVKHADLEDNLSPQRGRGLNDKIRSKIYLGLEIIEAKYPNLK
jgi:(p)ppGpp synthase/HD superfamily hydrolase